MHNFIIINSSLTFLFYSFVVYGHSSIRSFNTEHVNIMNIMESIKWQVQCLLYVVHLTAYRRRAKVSLLSSSLGPSPPPLSHPLGQANSDTEGRKSKRVKRQRATLTITSAVGGGGGGGHKGDNIKL